PTARPSSRWSVVRTRRAHRDRTDRGIPPPQCGSAAAGMPPPAPRDQHCDRLPYFWVRTISFPAVFGPRPSSQGRHCPCATVGQKPHDSAAQHPHEEKSEKSRKKGGLSSDLGIVLLPFLPDEPCLASNKRFLTRKE